MPDWKWTKESMCRIILKSAPWKATSEGMSRLSCFCLVFFLLVAAFNATRTILLVWFVPEKPTEATSTTPKTAFTRAMDTHVRSLGLETVIMFAVTNVAILNPVLAVHLRSLRFFVQYMDYNQLTDELAQPDQATLYRISCRRTIILSALLYLLASLPLRLFVDTTHTWVLLSVFAFVDYPIAGILIYLAIWWLAWPGPSTLN